MNSHLRIEIQTEFGSAMSGLSYRNREVHVLCSRLKIRR